MRPGDLCCRYGGEEFAVIAQGQSEKQLAELAEAVRSAIELTPVTYNNLDLHITASLGVTTNELGKRPATANAMIEAADQNLYRAKESGRNRVETTHTAWGLGKKTEIDPPSTNQQSGAA